MHKIHSHCQLILDPGSAVYDHFRGGEAPSEVVVASRFRIQDQLAMAVDFMQNIRTFGQKFLYLTKIEVLIPHHAFYQLESNFLIVTLLRLSQIWRHLLKYLIFTKRARVQTALHVS